MTLTTDLQALLARTTLQVSEQQVHLLIQYVELLHKWNKAYNLLGIDPNKLSQFSGRA